MGAFRPRNGSTRVVVSGAPTKKATVACLSSQTCAQKATSRAKKLESPKRAFASPRRRSLPDNVTKAKLPLDESTSAGPSRRRSVTFPRNLPRPQFKEPSNEALAAVGFESMVNEDRNILRMMVDSVIPQLNYMSALYNYKASSFEPSSVPSELVLDYSHNNTLPTVPPTHMLAISGKPNPSSKVANKVTLYPVHSAVLAVHCASLPTCPPTIPVDQTLADENKVRLPVWQLSVPSPETFPHLQVYLYCKDASVLFKACLPTAPPTQGECTIASFAQQLAETHSAPSLVKHLELVHGLWRNVCVLRIFDLRLWAAMDLMWTTLLSAIDVIVKQQRASKREGVESTPVSPPA